MFIYYWFINWYRHIAKGKTHRLINTGNWFAKFSLFLQKKKIKKSNKLLHIFISLKHFIKFMCVCVGVSVLRVEYVGIAPLAYVYNLF